MVVKASLTSSLRTDRCTFCNGFKSAILTRLLVLITSPARGWPAVAHCVTPAGCWPGLLLIMVWCAIFPEWQGHWRMECREQETTRASIRHLRDSAAFAQKQDPKGPPWPVGRHAGNFQCTLHFVAFGSQTQSCRESLTTAHTVSTHATTLQEHSKSFPAAFLPGLATALIATIAGRARGAGCPQRFLLRWRTPHLKGPSIP